MRRFGHWLERQVAYEALLISARKDLHRHVAVAIEEGLGSHEDRGVTLDLGGLRRAALMESSPPERIAAVGRELARHWWAADEPARAAWLSLLALRRLGLQGRNREALSALPEIERIVVQSGEARAASLLGLLRARLLERTGSFEASLETWDGVERGLRASDDEEGATLAARAAVGRSETLDRLGRFPEAGEAAESGRALARRARAPDIEAGALHMAGNVAFSTGAYEQALRWYEAEEALGVEDPRRRIALASDRALVLWSRGDLASAVRMQQATLDARRSMGDRWGTVISLSNLANSHATAGHYAEAAQSLREAAEISVETGNRFGAAAAAVNLAAVELHTGDFESASRHAGESLAFAEATGVRDLRCHSLAVRAQAQVRLGRREEALADARSAQAVAEQVGAEDGKILARTAEALAAGDPEIARDAVDRARRLGHRERELEASLILAELLTRRGNAAEAAAIADSVVRAAESAGMAGIAERARQVRRNPGH